MKISTELKGIENFQRSVNNIIKKVNDNTMKGLIGSAILIRRHMDKVEPTIPVDTNNLRGSWFATPDSFQRAVRIGFSANYAIWVHENMENKNFTRKGSGPKFLESALKANVKTILNTIKEANKL